MQISTKYNTLMEVGSSSMVKQLHFQYIWVLLKYTLFFEIMQTFMCIH